MEEPLIVRDRDGDVYVRQADGRYKQVTGPSAYVVSLESLEAYHGPVEVPRWIQIARQAPGHYHDPSGQYDYCVTDHSFDGPVM